MAYSAALQTVYNHYLKTYLQTRPSRYDAHNRRELRSIYNSIADINRKAPLYLLDNNKETHEFAIGIKENARQLRNTIASLGGLDEDDILNKKAASSSNANIVSAFYIGDNEDLNKAPEFDITVNQLATGQVNHGYLLTADEKIDLPLGSYSFDLSFADTNYEFQFQINEDETNLDIQNRLARLFENADLGLTAKVTQNASGYSYLTMETNETGLSPDKEHQFTISDERSSKSIGTVAYLGLANVTQKATNAEFLLNGELKTARSNHFTVGKMFDLTLNNVNKEDDPPVHIGLKTSIESIGENINELISGYNTFINSVNNLNHSHHRDSHIIKEMQSISKYYYNDMANLGLSLEDDGQLKVLDDAKLMHSLNSDDEDSETSAAGLQTLKSFTNAILRKSNQITLNPMEYVDKKMVSYKNPNRSFINPYVISAYSGMMFNGYC